MLAIRLILWSSLLLVGALNAGAGAQPGSAPARSAPGVPAGLPQQAYVWQRAWTDAVRVAVRGQANQFAGLVCLHAEVSWRQGKPRVVRVPVEFSALRELSQPVGLALRVGPFPGPFARADAPARGLAELAATLVEEARTNGLVPAELQLDFDCAESNLAGYREWVIALRTRIAPIPLVITALPAWQSQKAFRGLAAAADGYVLQVHSLDRPRGMGAPFRLCDPVQARAAVETAARMGSPFRIALPTYGYWVAFDRRGEFVGLSAEGPSLHWPEGVQVREARADPNELAALVADWSRNPPASCQGVIWYRLPITNENLNWPPATLSMVMSGRSPVAELRLEARRSAARLLELDLVNAGTAPSAGPVRVRVRWRHGKLVAGDGLHGFTLAEQPPDGVRLTSQDSRLRPGQRQQIGWMRFNQETEVELEMELEKIPGTGASAAGRGR